jgi:UDPglucose--hexose-1-phosphate uridylyltransferase
MDIFEPGLHPHRRYNPLLDEWILVSPHRTQRPWQGHKEQTTAHTRPEYDPNCYLCPGNRRAGNHVNPNYTDVFVFTNDFSALLPETPKNISNSKSKFFRYQPVQGECRVICFSPRHDLTLPEMDVQKIRKVIQVWIEQTIELGKKYQWVQIFENKGSIMGCSNPHPHGQIWAGDWVPVFVEREDFTQRKYFESNGKPLLIDYLESELASAERIVEQNDDWIFLVPFWATWPFETLLLPKRHIPRITELTDYEIDSLAAILKSTLTKYDNLFETSFPYSMGWHFAPMHAQEINQWQLHGHFYPPLLRSATVKKFMVGYEMLAEAQRDITPEQAAARLKLLPSTHYKSSLKSV